MNQNSKLGNLTIEEVLELEREMRDITTFIPDSKMDYVWRMYQKIQNTTEPKPCGCRSASGLWIKAVETINNFLKECQKQVV